MKYEIISNFNFNDISMYTGPKPKYYDRHYGYYRNGDTIVFKSNFICCPCIYWIKKDDKFCFSFDPDNVANFAKAYNIDISDDYRNFNQINSNLNEHVKSSIKKRYKYNLNYIEGWSQVVLYSDGSFEVSKNTFRPFQLDIKYNYDAFKKLIIKYKNIINSLIDDGLFLPTITGGLDTRGFINFYKDRVNELDGYFLTSVKQDGKDHIEQGLLEMKIAEQVVNKIGLKNNRVEKLEDCDIPYVTLSGFFNENSELYNIAEDIDYIYKIVQHGWDNTHQYINKLTIFMDDDYLQFKPDKNFKNIMILLLKELIFVPFISGASMYRHFKEGCCVYPEFKNNLASAIDIFEYWGEERVKNLFKN